MNIASKTKAIICIVLSAVIVLSCASCGNDDAKVEMPNIVNMTLDEAKKVLAENGLTFFVSAIEITDSVDENVVLSQKPEAGGKVEKSSPVSLVISKKPYAIDVPDVTDYSKELAREKIELSGAKVEIKEEYSDSIPSGTVISQSVKGKASVGDTVTLVVSKGREDSKDAKVSKDVPNVVSMTKQEAKTALASKGVQMSVVGEEYSSEVKKGEIISQKTNEKTGTVEVVVSKGSAKDEKITVPDVSFRTQSEAKSMLEQRGLKVKVENKESSVVAKGAVIDQSPKAGEKVSAGSTVTIGVSAGRQEKTYDKTTASPTTVKIPQSSTTKQGNEKTTSSATTKPKSDEKTTRPLVITQSYDKEAEKNYMADFKITTDKQTAKAGDLVKVSVALKTNYRIFTVMLPVIYDSDVFEMQNTSESDLSSFLTFEGRLSKTYKTNGNWKSVPQMYSRNNNESYWTKSDVMKKWKIAYAAWSVDVSASKTPVMLSDEETIVSFTLKVKSGADSAQGRIFISSDFQKTTDCVKGILAVGRCKNETVDLNFVDRDQTIKVDRADVKVSIN